LIARQIRIRIRRILHMKSASDGCGYWLAPSHPYYERKSPIVSFAFTCKLSHCAAPSSACKQRFKKTSDVVQRYVILNVF